MLIRKDIEAIFSTPELWQAFHELEELYHFRNSSADLNTRYKAAFQLFQAKVETSK